MKLVKLIPLEGGRRNLTKTEYNRAKRARRKARGK
jgi:hypothetical protein